MFGFIGANVGFVEVINGDSLVIFLYFIDIRWLDLQSYLRYQICFINVVNGNLW
jgi:hypothetical protein